MATENAQAGIGKCGHAWAEPCPSCGIDIPRTIAQLERERDEWQTDSLMWRDETRLALAQLDRVRADAARMRLALEMYGRHSGVCSSVAPRGDGGCDCGYLSALTPDDGWLARHDAELARKFMLYHNEGECARRIEEAVEPYRALIERVATMQKNDWIALSLEARALRGGTPGGDE